MDLVEDDQSIREAFQVEPGVGQLVPVLLGFQVQIQCLALSTEHPGQGGLADLAGADEGDGGLAGEGRA